MAPKMSIGWNYRVTQQILDHNLQKVSKNSQKMVKKWFKTDQKVVQIWSKIGKNGP